MFENLTTFEFYCVIWMVVGACYGGITVEAAKANKFHPAAALLIAAIVFWIWPVLAVCGIYRSFAGAYREVYTKKKPAPKSPYTKP